jgi:hypothetical protein
MILGAGSAVEVEWSDLDESHPRQTEGFVT